MPEECHTWSLEDRGPSRRSFETGRTVDTISKAVARQHRPGSPAGGPIALVVGEPNPPFLTQCSAAVAWRLVLDLWRSRGAERSGRSRCLSRITPNYSPESPNRDLRVLPMPSAGPAGSFGFCDYAPEQPRRCTCHATGRSKPAHLRVCLVHIRRTRVSCPLARRRVVVGGWIGE